MMQTIKKTSYLIIMIAVALLIAGTAIIVLKRNKPTVDGVVAVDLRSLKMADGWGYEVLVDEKVYIHQDCIPAIATYKRFISEKEALTVGNKVLEKIKQGHKPSLTVQDINELHIHY